MGSFWSEKSFLYSHGIYTIVNRANGCMYLGSSSGRGFGNRKGTHWRSLEANKHHSIYLQRAWNKYGADNFEFRVLLYCDANKTLDYEQLFLDHYRPVYNISPTAGNCLGIKRSQSTKDKISAIHRGKTVSQTTKLKMSAYHKEYNTVTRMLTPDARARAISSRLNSNYRGDNHACSKISTQDVLQIREFYKQGRNYNQISKLFPIDRRTVRDICLRRSWQHV